MKADVIKWDSSMADRCLKRLSRSASARTVIKKSDIKNAASETTGVGHWEEFEKAMHEIMHN